MRRKPFAVLIAVGGLTAVALAVFLFRPPSFQREGFSAVGDADSVLDHWPRNGFDSAVGATDDLAPRWSDIEPPHLWPPQQLYIQVDHLASAYEKLRRDAEAGSASSARELFYGLRRCADAFRDQASLAAAIDQLYQTHTFRRPNGVLERVLVGDAPNDLETHERVLREDYDYCLNLPLEFLKEAPRWRDTAIANGAVDVALEYAYSVREPAERAAAFFRAFELGTPAALGPLSDLYEHGWEGQMPDKVTAYAYAYAYAELMRLSLGEKHVLSEAAESLLKEKTKLMYRYQLDAAKPIVKRILEGNPNCCMEMRVSTIVGQ
jgi:hypothetical protein